MGERRAALVTGASGGIGRTLAVALAQEGYALTLAARREEGLRELAGELGGEEPLLVPGDLTDEAACAATVAAHAERHGRLDVLVNCAGLGAAQPVARLTADRLDLQLDLNVRATALMCREASGLLVEAGRETGTALILNMGSVVAKQGAAGFAIYSATKAAVVGLSQALNQELGPQGVKCTALCPSLVDTPMTDFIKDRIPPERMIQRADLVQVLRMLLALSPSCVVPELLLTPPGGRPAFE